MTRSYDGTPRPIGYVETQVSWLEPKPDDEIRLLLEEAKAKAISDDPSLIYYGARAEHVRDGAGVGHVNVYLSFVPRVQTTPPLDPHNLNDAPRPPIGSIPVEDIGGAALGWMEQQFGRGKP